MGTQGPGRKRIPNREKLTAEDDALNQIAREAEARLAAKRAARAEAREIRMKELERQQKEMSDDEEKMSVGSRGSFRVEERPDRDFVDKGSRTASTLSAATLASLGGASSRRGSCDTSFSVETEASIRDMKDSLVESEEKYRRAMVSNAQLHNEKSALMYQVETLKEELSDMEELLWESRRLSDDRSKEVERQRQAHSVLQFQFREMEEALRQTEELLTKHGVVVSPDASTNGETGLDDDVSAESASRLAQEAPGRQSMLGTVAERQPAEGSKLLYDQRIHKHSLNVSAGDQTKQVKGFDKLSRDRTGRNKDARSQWKNKGREKDPKKKQNKWSRNSLFSQARYGDSVSVRRASTEKVLKSRLVPPRPAEDMILENKVSRVLASGKLDCQEEQEAAGMGSSDWDVAQKRLSAVDQFCQNPDQDGNSFKDGRSSGGEVVSDDPCSGAKGRRINEFSTPTSEDRVKENEFVKFPEIDDDECNEEEDTTEATWGSSRNENLKGDLSRSCVPEGPNSETKPKSSEVEATGGEKSGSPEEPVLEAVQVQDDQTQTPKSVTQDWTCLEKTIQSMLRGFVQNQGLSESLKRRISDFQEKLKNVAENVTDDEPTGQMIRVKVTELPLKDFPEGRRRREDPEGEEPGAAAASEMEVTSLEVHPQPHGVTMDCEDIQDPTSGVIGHFNVEVTGSCQEEEEESRLSSSEEFVFVEFYFSEPAEELETQLKKHRRFPKNAGRSKVRRLLEVTAEEIKAMALPELILHEGKFMEPQQEVLPGDMDSCEEAATQPATRVLIEPVTMATSVNHLRGNGRKHKRKTDCSIL